MSYSREGAEALALKALEFLVGDEDLLPVFMGSTGAGADDLREGAGDPAFLGAVLDFIMMDDQWLIRFCDGHNLSYDSIYPARQALPGGENVNWT